MNYLTEVFLFESYQQEIWKAHLEGKQDTAISVR